MHDEASFVIMKAINYIKEREEKFLPVSWMYTKHLAQCGYAIPKIKMLHNLSCLETRFRLLCR